MIKAVIRWVLTVIAVVLVFLAWRQVERKCDSCSVGGLSISPVELFQHDLPTVIGEIKEGQFVGGEKEASFSASFNGQEIAQNIQEKLMETTGRAQELIGKSQQLATELDLDLGILQTASHEGEANQGETSTTPEAESLREKVTDLGQYLYCREVVTDFAVAHPNIDEILPTN